MTQSDMPEIPEDAPEPTRRKRWVRPLLVLVVIVLVLATGAVSMIGRSLTLPAEMTNRIERALTGQMLGGIVNLDDVSVELDRTLTPRILLRNLSARDGAGARIGQIEEIGVELSAAAMWDWQLRPTDLRISGVQATIRRALDGTVSLSLGEATTTPENLPDVLTAIDDAFTLPVLTSLATVTATDLTITLEDARSGRVWQVTDGLLTLKNEADRIEIDILTEVFNGTEDLAQVQVSFNSRKDSPAAELAVNVDGAAARDIALQSPALSYLALLDAPVSGAIRTVFDTDGAVDILAATLEIGEGALQPVAEASPVPFNRARAYLTYDPEKARVEFSELSVESDLVRLSSTGHAYLQDFDGAWPGSLVSQMRISALELAAEGLFDAPLMLSSGAVDMRLRLAPFAVDLGQFYLAGEDYRVSGGGRVWADNDGWQAAVDLSSHDLLRDQVLALWPQGVAPGAKRWIVNNLHGGLVETVSIALRLQQDDVEPDLGLSFGFSGAAAQYIKGFPPIRGGAGHASLLNGKFAAYLTKGTVDAAAEGHRGSVVNAAGSTVVIPDVYAKPGEAVVGLEAASSLTSALSLLNRPPLELMEKAGREVDIADAAARASALIRVPLARDVALEEVAFDVSGRLTDVVSDRIVRDRILRSQALDLSADDDGVTVSGPLTLDGAPMNLTWRQEFGEGRGQTSRVVGQVALSPVFARTFGITYPDGLISGQGQGTVAIDIEGDAPPEFSLTSDLTGIEMTLGGLGWSKPADVPGLFEIAGRFGQPVEIDRLALSAPDLTVNGLIRLDPDGQFDAAEFETVQLGDWFVAPVTLIGQGADVAPLVQILGGTIDLTRREEAEDDIGGDSVPVEARLDQVVIREGLVATDVVAQVTTGQGLTGNVQGRVNGGAPFAARLVPQNGRTAFRVQGDNAGQILRDAGLFKSLDDGSLDLILVPRDGEGFDGQIEIGNARLGDQPVLADLLDAVSIVGIIDQLQGPGILFDQIDGRFQLVNDQLILSQGSATGASLGISLDGVYDTRSEQLDMGGVISPVYLLNSVGQLFTRRGEGLFGFTFRLTGNADAPRMRVNPLSILTPGMFREIFRRPPPAPPE